MDIHPDIHQATRSYESWLARQTTIVSRDLRLKHARMAESPFVFLRGTFYRWIERWPSECPDLASAPAVLSVGDLHVENFGTWRDSEGRLIWGVNDVDEACVLPYTQDLVRLATSAWLAIRQCHFTLSRRQACDAILAGYRSSLDRGGRPIVLEERRRWLRQIALNDLRDPGVFWARLQALRPATGPVPNAILRAALPSPQLPYRVVQRVAGVGSLGRQRFVALAEYGGASIARESKAFVPSAAAWARNAATAPPRIDSLLRAAVRVADPLFSLRGTWIVRRLAPDCSRIELEQLPRKRDEEKLLRAMGWETANMHLGTRSPRLRADLGARNGRWLERAATRMAEIVEDEWRDWK